MDVCGSLHSSASGSELSSKFSGVTSICAQLSSTFLVLILGLVLFSCDWISTIRLLETRGSEDKSASKLGLTFDFVTAAAADDDDASAVAGSIVGGDDVLDLVECAGGGMGAGRSGPLDVVTFSGAPVGVEVTEVILRFLEGGEGGGGVGI